MQQNTHTYTQHTHTKYITHCWTRELWRLIVWYLHGQSGSNAHHLQPLRDDHILVVHFRRQTIHTPTGAERIIHIHTAQSNTTRQDKDEQCLWVGFRELWKEFLNIWNLVHTWYQRVPKIFYHQHPTHSFTVIRLISDLRISHSIPLRDTASKSSCWSRESIVRPNWPISAIGPHTIDRGELSCS